MFLRYCVLFKAIFDNEVKSVRDEMKSETSEMAPSFMKNTLPSLLSRYPLQNIFNASEFGLFYQCLPDKTFCFLNENCVDGQHSKVRLTGMLAGNAFGERLQMFVIGKPVNPCCFNNIKNIPCRYRAQKKSWMNSELFEEWVKELDCSFGASKRKIALVIDICPAHSEVSGLQWVELIFLPSNTQPMNQGVVRTLKAKYRSLAVKKQILNLENGSELPKFSILTAMIMLQKAWDSVPNDTFTSCFRKAGIPSESVDLERTLNFESYSSADLEVDKNIIKELDEDLKKMKNKFCIDYQMTAEELVDVDSQIPISGTKSDADIIAKVYGDSVDYSDDESDDDELNHLQHAKPSYIDVLNAISTLEDYSVFSNFGNDVMAALNNINKVLELERQSNVYDNSQRP